MKPNLSVFCLIFALAINASGAPIINVTQALAPNVFGSPSYPTWEANAVNGMMNGGMATGTPGTPGYFQPVSSVGGNAVLVTSFNSWIGQTDPGTAFGPAFASELGNRAAFPLAILGNGSQFSISQLAFSATSTDAFNALGFSFAAGSYNYGSGYVGVLYGLDGALGGGDDTLVTGGSNTQLVDALFGRGSGNALWPCGPGDPTPCATPAEQQAALDLWSAYNAPTTWYFNGTYTLSGVQGGPIATGTGSLQINPTGDVPEPTTVGLIGSGLATFLFFRRRIGA